AVLPAGLDRLYPVGNRDLFDRIIEHGLLVSERPPGSTPCRETFLGRNRVVTALTGATVVVEAAMRSGALHSAEWARRLGRPLGAVPGPITSAASYGTHHLLQKRVANLITDPSDIVEQLGGLTAAAEVPRGLHGIAAPAVGRAESEVRRPAP